MTHRFLYRALLISCVVLARPGQAQPEENVTLLLKDGEQIQATVYDIWQGELYFRAASAVQAYEYGERIDLAHIERVRLTDGRILQPQEFAQRWKTAATAPRTAAGPRASPASSPAPAAQYGPGLRLQSAVTRDTLRARGGVGLRMPEMPRADTTPALNYNEVADLLAEAGLAGHLLYDVSSGELKRRQLTPSQRQLVDALLQSRAWGARKRDLRAAHLLALGEFEKVYKDASPAINELFKLRPANPALVFLEFVQYLRAENAHLFSDKWEKVEKTFTPATEAALRDLLSNYEDWYYLYGQELEKQGSK
jgi:hypothetical protein